MLVSIGEHPVNSLSDTGISEASIARDILHHVSRQVQATGLQCNSEENFPLSRDVEGYIRVPSNTLKIDSSNVLEEVVLRGRRLYDKTNHTYKFKKDLKVDIVLFLAFEELPQVVRDYITVRAARVFQSKVLGSEILHQFTMQDEFEARAAMMQEEIDTGDYNILRNSDLQMMLRRS